MSEPHSLDDVIARHRHREGALMPILNDVQSECGHISEGAIREIASALNLTRADVYGVVSFYHDYKAAPDPRPVLKLCRAEACQARGVDALLSIAEGQSRVKIEPVYCLGLCAVGPAALVGDSVFARLDTVTFARLLDAQ